MGVDARVLAPCDGPPPDAAVPPLGRSMPTADNAQPGRRDGPPLVVRARCGPGKGLADLPAARPGLPSDAPDRLAGAGRGTGRLRAHFAKDERVQWLGRLSDNDVASRLRGAD